MKNLDLNGLGVQEMNAKEMVSVDGGFWAIVGAIILTGLVYEEITEGPTKCWNDFVKGYNSVR